MTTPKISIIIPVYKTEAYLEKCLRSVLEGDFKDVEVILVNDGSPNGHECSKYAEEDPRVKVIHQENKGVAAARNEGLRHATAPYIGFVDSDDWIHPHMYQQLYQLAKEHNADIVSCGMLEYVNDYPKKKNCKPLGTDAPLEIMTGTKALKRSLLSHPTAYSVVCDKLFARHLFDEISFPQGRVSGEDAAVTYKLYHRANRVVHTHTAYYAYVIRSQSVTNKMFSVSAMHKLDTAEEAAKYIQIHAPDLNYYAKSFEIITALRLAAYFDKPTQKQYPAEYTKINQILISANNHAKALLPQRHKILLTLYKFCKPAFFAIWRRRLKAA